MGRTCGAIDRKKRQAVLDAAAGALAEHGRDVTVSEIAKRSGVSRQTIYNHFASRDELLGALSMLKAFTPCPSCPPGMAGSTEAMLAAYAATLLAWVRDPRQATAFRAAVRGFDGTPDEAQRLHRATLGRACRDLAEVLAQETRGGELDVEDPAAVADLFLNLVLAPAQLAIVEGADLPMAPEDIENRARLCARLFVRGYAARPAPERQHPIHVNPVPEEERSR